MRGLLALGNERREDDVPMGLRIGIDDLCFISDRAVLIALSPHRPHTPTGGVADGRRCSWRAME